MFFYRKNKNSDPDLSNLAGETVVPIGWWWERIGETNGRYIHLSVSLMFTFFLYMLVSFVEFILWILYCFEIMDPARWFFHTVGYWGSLVGYFLPVLFAMIQLGSTLSGQTTSFPGAWSFE